MKVLIADDSSLSRKLVLKALPELLTEEVSQAANGQEVLAAYEAGQAEIIFLDLTMPVMDGFETLERLRKSEAEAIIIVVSADIQPLARQRVMELGAAAFIKKPITSEAMNAVLHEIGVV
ncbi:chemotaxis protein [Pseudomonas sp. 1D4]|uniref:response regulator n=1 Tax=Pseudomonadaceae TaxID=135621 RepID=UPI00084B1AC2|nr:MULTISPECIES: response regulator [Pseudomonas]OEC39678.1 chemotaxis protein [Pseudomonas sp. 1D4]OEC53527.1 chemotaxis protein [Pseudomonas sp. ENNP23]